MQRKEGKEGARGDPKRLIFWDLLFTSDVMDILPHSDHQKLYQRKLDVPFEEPKSEDVVFPVL